MIKQYLEIIRLEFELFNNWWWVFLLAILIILFLIWIIGRSNR